MYNERMTWKKGEDFSQGSTRKMFSPSFNGSISLNLQMFAVVKLLF